MHLFMYHMLNPQMYTGDVQYHGQCRENKAKSWMGFVGGWVLHVYDVIKNYIDFFLYLFLMSTFTDHHFKSVF